MHVGRLWLAAEKERGARHGASGIRRDRQRNRGENPGHQLWRDGDPGITLRSGECKVKGLNKSSCAIQSFFRGLAPRRSTTSFQNRPTILPPSSRPMTSAEGILGRPGMVMMSPQTTTMNSAPAARRTSRIGTTWSTGAPFRLGSVEKEYCVLAMQIGNLP